MHKVPNPYSLPWVLCFSDTVPPLCALNPSSSQLCLVDSLRHAFFRKPQQDLRLIWLPFPAPNTLCAHSSAMGWPPPGLIAGPVLFAAAPAPEPALAWRRVSIG